LVAQINPGDDVSRTLKSEGFIIPDDDLAAISAAWTSLKAKTERLWFPEARYAEPALCFRADPDRDD
jgi:hypothetical protein